MSLDQLKELLGAQETVLELVQLDGGELALRTVGSSQQEALVKIQFNDEVKALLGDATPVVAQHMVQAALFGLMEHQMGKWHATVIDEKPKFYS